MLLEIVRQWRMIVSACLLLALAAFGLIKGVAVLAEGGQATSGSARQNVDTPTAMAGSQPAAASPVGRAGAEAEVVRAESDAVTPRPPVGPSYHTVEAGESLSKIAAEYGITTAALADANGITNPDRIRVGQRLVIPAR